MNASVSGSICPTTICWFAAYPSMVSSAPALVLAYASQMWPALSTTSSGELSMVSPEDAAKLTKERDDLSAQNKAYAVSAMKMKAANEKGIPLELAEKLSGETEEDINNDAESFAKYFSVQKCKPTPRYSRESGAVDANTAAQLEMLRELKN